MIKKPLTNRIREFRVDYLGLTQEEMAHDLGYTIDKIKAAESGKAGVREVARVMQPVYEVALAWLLGEKNGPATTRLGDKRPSRKTSPLPRKRPANRNARKAEWQEHELDRLTIEYAKVMRAILKNCVGSPRFSAAVARVFYFLEEIESIFGSDSATVDCDSLAEILALDSYPLDAFPTLSSRNQRLEERMRTCLHKAAASLYNQINEKGLGAIIEDRHYAQILPPGGLRKIIEAGLMAEGPPQSVTYIHKTKVAQIVSEITSGTGNSDAQQTSTLILETASKTPVHLSDELN